MSKVEKRAIYTAQEIVMILKEAKAEGYRYIEVEGLKAGLDVQRGPGPAPKADPAPNAATKLSSRGGPAAPQQTRRQTRHLPPLRAEFGTCEAHNIPLTLNNHGNPWCFDCWREKKIAKGEWVDPE